jgi:hypothetical protein
VRQRTHQNRQQYGEALDWIWDHKLGRANGTTDGALNREPGLVQARDGSTFTEDGVIVSGKEMNTIVDATTTPPEEMTGVAGNGTRRIEEIVTEVQNFFKDDYVQDQMYDREYPDDQQAILNQDQRGSEKAEVATTSTTAVQ